MLLLDYRVHQRRLLPALAKTYALHFAQTEVVAELDRIFGGDADDEEARRLLETQAAGLKAIATWLEKELDAREDTSPSTSPSQSGSRSNPTEGES